MAALTINFQKVTGERIDDSCVDESKVKAADLTKALAACLGEKSEDFKKLAKSSITATFESFTEAGDTFISGIFSLKVVHGESKLEIPLVVKIHKSNNDAWVSNFSLNAFPKEIKFYTTLLPAFNEALSALKQPKLKFPNYFNSVETVGKQVIYLEDLRASGYKMTDKKNGLNMEEATLIIKELGRMHAASKLVIKKEELKGVDMLPKYGLQEIWTTVYANKETMVKYWESGINFAIGLLHGNSDAKYKKISERLVEFKKNVYENAFEMLECTEEFRVVCHGDCWINNFMFKYEGSKASDCALLDLQTSRMGSLGLDLNHLFWSSINHEVRAEHATALLNTYYDSFSSIMVTAGQPMDFSFDELHKEFKSKNLYGLYIGLLTLKPIIINRELLPNLKNLTEEQMKEMKENFGKVREAINNDEPRAIPTYMAFIDQLDNLKLFD